MGPPPSDLAADVAGVAHAIQLSVSPVFLISGIGGLLTLFANRLARIVDRARVLDERLTTAVEPDRGRLLTRLRELTRRAHAIHVAILAGSTSALLVATVVVLIFAGAFVRFPLGVLVAILFCGAMVALVLALACFLFEVRLAIPRESWDRR